jgi:hypothetical protein
MLARQLLHPLYFVLTPLFPTPGVPAYNAGEWMKDTVAT